MPDENPPGLVPMKMARFSSAAPRRARHPGDRLVAKTAVSFSTCSRSGIYENELFTANQQNERSHVYRTRFPGHKFVMRRA